MKMKRILLHTISLLPLYFSCASSCFALTNPMTKEEFQLEVFNNRASVYVNNKLNADQNITNFDKAYQTSRENTLLTEIKQAKASLRHVREQDQNLYAKSLKTSDPYDARKDFSDLVKKIRRSETLLFKNDSDKDVKIKIKLKPADYKNETDAFIKKVTIAPGEFYILEQKDTVLGGVRLVNNKELFLNPKWTLDSHPQFTIEKQEDRLFLHQYHHFDFDSKPFSNESIDDPNLSAEESQFKRGFNAHLQYIDHVFAKGEGTTLKEIDEHQRLLYQKNNIAAILEKKPHALDSSDVKIPLLTHTIWVTSDDKPVSIPNYYLNWLGETIKANPTSEGWTHNLWIESKEKLPELAKKLENHPYIKLRELKDMPLGFMGLDEEYKQAMQNKQFGKATDILRLVILAQMGGWYKDTDYKFSHSMKAYSKNYNLVMGREPMSALLCNACIGASPNHPTILEGLRLIKRNVNPETAPEYIKANSDKGWKTIVETGPAMVTAAFKNTAGKNGNVDIALPPQLIYPTPVDEYPRKNVVIPNGPMPAEALGAHFWETAWMKKEFGSQG